MKITFPRESEEGRNREHNLKPDEVLVKGGKKGVAGAKSELLDVRSSLHPTTTQLTLFFAGS